ncbi:hypothetical protein AB4K05_14770 [Kluyvera sp. STS39-E]|uniref:hypothetical protein n=1 Tax=Kluyvera sp. STS39-E TaxID=3234748 RepID=UPI0034C5E135
MKKMNNKTNIITGIIVAVSLMLSAYFILTRPVNNGISVNCSTILNLLHKTPDFTSAIDLRFQLRTNHTGQVDLSGNIKQADGIRFVSRTVLFDYEMSAPGDIAIENMRYVKNKKDSANDHDFKLSFFYVQEGQKRHIKVNPLHNAYLIENTLSPVLLCVNKDN